MVNVDKVILFSMHKSHISLFNSENETSNDGAHLNNMGFILFSVHPD